MTRAERVLVVEDEWIVARAVQKTLEAAGFGVTDVVGSAREAVESVERQDPDLVLLDIVLQSGNDGVQLAHELREKTDAPIIFVTAHADEHTLGRAAAVRPAGFVVKPFQEAQLLSAVTMAVCQPRGRTEIPVRVEPEPGAADVQRDMGEPVSERRARLVQVASAVSNLVPAGQRTDLTTRELEIVRLLLSNGRVSSIAERLSLSPHTVRNHLRSIFKKLGVHSQVELIRELTTHQPVAGSSRP